jgi:hypothetical protein
MKAPPLLASRGLLGVEKPVTGLERRDGERPYIAFDSHTHYTLARVKNAAGHQTADARIAHERGALKGF